VTERIAFNEYPKLIVSHEVFTIITIKFIYQSKTVLGGRSSGCWSQIFVFLSRTGGEWCYW